MKQFILAFSLIIATSSVQAAEPLKLAGLLPSPKIENFTPIVKVVSLTCKCGTTEKTFDITCTAPKKPTCVCSNPGNNPSATCM